MMYKNTNKSCGFVIFILCDAGIHADSKNVICILIACSIVEKLKIIIGFVLSLRQAPPLPSSPV